MYDVDQLKSRLIEEWEHFHQVFIDEAIRQWRPRLRACIRGHGGHFELRLFDILIDVHFDSHNCTIAYSGHCRFGGDLTKPAITTASVERFYSDLVICLQLDIALLFQKSVKS